MSETTHWRSVWLLFFCGCTLALHIGKLPPALPLITDAFALRLSQAGVLVGMFSILIAVTGLLLGVVVARLGYVAFAVFGVALAGIASIVGATTESILVLSISRALEGLGWIVAVIAIPTLMVRLSRPSDTPIVLGIWGGFFSAGAGTMLLIAPYLQNAGGWQLSWWFAGGASLIASIIVFEIGRRYKLKFAPLKQNTIINPWKELKTGRAVGLFFCFLFYSFPYAALTAFLPTVLIEQSGMNLGLASQLTAIVMLANVLGNACAVAFSIAGGLIPGTLFSTGSRIASTPAATGILFGLMLQAAGVGQWLGPLVLTRVVESTELWWAGGLLLLFMALMGMAAAFVSFRSLKL